MTIYGGCNDYSEKRMRTKVCTRFFYAFIFGVTKDIWKAING